MATFAIPITMSPVGMTPLSISASTVAVEEDDSNLPGSWEAENNPTGVPVWVSANDRIQTDQNIRIRLSWTMNGIMNPFLTINRYTCNAYFEKMGSGEASSNYQSPAISHTGTSAPYNATISVPAGSLTPGVYRLVVSLTTTANPAGSASLNFGFPIVGFVDCGLYQIYES